MAVTAQIILEGIAQPHIGVLQLDKDQGQPVNVQDYIGATVGGLRGLAHRLDPQLGDRQPAVLFRIVKMNQPDFLVLFDAALIIKLNRHATPDQVIQFPVGLKP